MVSLHMLYLAGFRTWRLICLVTLSHHVTSYFLSSTFSAKLEHHETSALLVSGQESSKIQCGQRCLTVKPCSFFEYKIPLCSLYREDGRKGGNSRTRMTFYEQTYQGKQEISSEYTDPVVLFQDKLGQFGHISLVTDTLLGYSNVRYPPIRNLVYSSKLNTFVARTRSSVIVFSYRSKCCQKEFTMAETTSSILAFDDEHRRIFLPGSNYLFVIDLVNGKQNKIPRSRKEMIGIAVDAKSKQLIGCQKKYIYVYTYQWNPTLCLYRNRNRKFIRSCTYDTKTQEVYFHINGIISMRTLDGSSRTPVFARLGVEYTNFLIYGQKIYTCNATGISSNGSEVETLNYIRVIACSWLCLKTND